MSRVFEKAGNLVFTEMDGDKYYYRRPNLKDRELFEQAIKKTKKDEKSQLEFGITLYALHACDDKGKPLFKASKEVWEDPDAALLIEDVVVKLVDYYLPNREALNAAKKPSSKARKKGK